MSDTLAYLNGKNTVPESRYGHSAKSRRFVETDQSSTSATLGDGGVYSNLVDLAKWDAALQDHTLLGEDGNACRAHAGQTRQWRSAALAARRPATTI